MKKFNFNQLFLVLVLLISTLSASAATIQVTADITSNTTWTRNNIYVLNGYRYVKNSAELTIEAGTVILGDKNSKGTLIIARGAKIFANGTACDPIVFTSAQPVGQRAAGDWGGVIILGNAPVNVPGGTAIIEGGVNNVTNDAVYGGTNASDNSGSFTYVRIEYPGIAFQPNNEINGLTLGGVGNGTTIHHVQVSWSGDDSFEWFGGTVNCSHLIAVAGLDDDFDTDLGYNGRVQFCFSMRDPNTADVSGSNAFESDNDGTGSSNNPFTSCVFSNVTVFGPKLYNNTINSLYRRAMHLRRNTRIGIYNSVLMSWAEGLLVDGTAAANNANNGTLDVRNTAITNMNVDFTVSSAQMSTVQTWFDNLNRSNFRNASNASFYTSVGTFTNPSFMPASNSAALSGASFTDARLNGLTSTNFRGAFGTENWAAGWSNFDPQTTVYTSTMVETVSNFALTGVTASSASFSWSAVNNATDYNIRYRKVGTTTWLSFSAGSPVTSITRTTSIQGGAAYEAQIRTRVAGTWGRYGCVVFFNTPCNTFSPRATVVLIPCPGQTGSITITSVTGATAPLTYNWTNPQGVTTNAITGLTGGTYVCNLTDANGCTGTFSRTINPVSANNVPTNITGSPIGNGGAVNITWTPVAGATTYGIGIRPAGTTSWSTASPGVISTSSTTASYNTPQLAAGNYDVRVRARVNGIWSAYSCLVQIQSTGIPRLGNNNTFTIYPNPTTGIVNLNGISSNGTIQVLNLLGQPVMTKQLNATTDNTIDLSNLTKGAYFVKWNTEGNVTTQKLVIE